MLDRSLVQEIFIYLIIENITTHSSTLAWRIPGMGEPGGLLSMGSHRVGHDWNNLAAAAAENIKCLLYANHWFGW